MDRYVNCPTLCNGEVRRGKRTRPKALIVDSEVYRGGCGEYSTGGVFCHDCQWVCPVEVIADVEGAESVRRQVVASASSANAGWNRIAGFKGAFA